MEYYVFIEKKSGVIVLIGKVKYQNDGETMLKNWHTGYITRNGEFVFRKNYTG